MTDDEIRATIERLQRGEISARRAADVLGKLRSADGWQRVKDAYQWAHVVSTDDPWHTFIAARDEYYR